MVLPAADESVRYDKHIKPLFRTRDRQSMTFVFDLWSYDDVPLPRRRHPRPAAQRDDALRRSLAGGEDRRVRTVDRVRHDRLTAAARCDRALGQ